MKKWFRVMLVAYFALAVPAAASQSPSIQVDGAFAKAGTLDADAILALPHVSMTANEEHGDAQVHYSGVQLAVLLGSVELGSFRILAPCDKTQARWVREVTGFSVVTAPRT